jgi:hypothetical protein
MYSVCSRGLHINDAFVAKVHEYFATVLAGKPGMDFEDFRAAAACVPLPFPDEVPLFALVVATTGTSS